MFCYVVVNLNAESLTEKTLQFTNFTLIGEGNMKIKYNFVWILACESYKRNCLLQIQFLHIIDHFIPKLLLGVAV